MSDHDLSNPFEQDLFSPVMMKQKLQLKFKDQNEMKPPRPVPKSIFDQFQRYQKLT
jgi:hypothetical protein